jgi:hypothetical protein
MPILDQAFADESIICSRAWVRPTFRDHGKRQETALAVLALVSVPVKAEEL